MATVKSRAQLLDLASRYLARFPCTRARLTRYLQGKLDEARADLRGGDLDAREWIAWVCNTLERHGYLDDRRFAEGRADALLSRGKGMRHIASDLRRRGVPTDLIDATLDQVRQREGDPDFAAACAWARRRRVGPFYRGSDRAAQRDKHLKQLARAGFPWPVVKRVIDAPDPESLGQGPT